jgi:hypothetical protein
MQQPYVDRRRARCSYPGARPELSPHRRVALASCALIDGVAPGAVTGAAKASVVLEGLPLVVLTAVAAALTVAGSIDVRRRDLDLP